MNLPDPALWDIFTAEQTEHLQRMRPLVSELAQPAARDAAYTDLLRRAHTLKGAARAVGFAESEALTHAFEGALLALREHSANLDPSQKSLLLRVLDTIEDVPSAAKTGRTLPEIPELLSRLAHITTASGDAPAESPPPAVPVTTSPSETGSGADPAVSDFVRIHTASLDELMSATAELLASAAVVGTDGNGERDLVRAEDALREWRQARQDAAPFIRGHQGDVDFAPVAECIETGDRQLHSLVRDLRTETDRRHQREWDLRSLAERLDETGLRVRMVSAETVFGGFGPMLRSLAHQTGKEIEFYTEGLEMPADRVVLQALRDPAMHLLRNALSHGIESREERLRAGKQPAGIIRLRLSSRGEQMEMRVEDDGQGIDYAALAEEAARHGMTSLRDSRISEELLTDLIFRPGFSTSEDLTTLAGRGMGLSVVREAVNKLHGEIHVQSEPGRGLRFVVTVPLSLSSQQVLLLSQGGHTFGVLTAFVERLTSFQNTDVQTIDGKPVVMVDATPVNLTRLSALLDLPAASRSGDDDDGNVHSFEAALLTAGPKRIALAVDGLLDVRDAIVKPTGLNRAEAGFSAGAVALPEGGVAIILNVPDLLDRSRSAAMAHAHTFIPETPLHRASRILVVDDSITTRSLEKSLLAAHGYDVEVAVDGIEAMEKLAHGEFDLVISDVMMPRMDGFQLLESIRRDPRLAKTPLIIVSSMESREDQERGLRLGADAYVVKRKFDQRELLKTVRQII